MSDKTGKKSGGRKKGTTNRKSHRFEELLKNHNYDPLEELLKLLTEDCFEKLSELLLNAASPEERTEIWRAMTLSVKDRASLNLKMLEFIYPKLKAIEIDGSVEIGPRTIKFVEK